MATQIFTYEQVAEHTTMNDLYMVINDKVYDITKFVDEHPGGGEILVDEGGKDATESFNDIGHSPEAIKMLEAYYIGDVDSAVSDRVMSGVVCLSVYFVRDGKKERKKTHGLGGSDKVETGISFLLLVNRQKETYTEEPSFCCCTYTCTSRKVSESIHY
ncbi:cytochrome b5-like heme/steroid binding domain-containing protein [Spinellus fusiger]|nr:cytochrome b5-like heme/steroid binding domain-containing protein [Spinellus fusiger]